MSTAANTTTITADDLVRTSAQDRLSIRVEQLTSVLYAIIDMGCSTTSTSRLAVESLQNMAHEMAMELQELCGPVAQEAFEAGKGMTTAAPILLDELRAAHTIICNALAVMTAEQKTAWGSSNERDGVAGEGITRANERLALIERIGGPA